MNIEQARALKIGDSMIRKASDNSFQITRVNDRGVWWARNEGYEEFSSFTNVAAFFYLPKAATPAQWIPFDKERMSEAEGYRASDTKEVITELNIYHVGSDIDISCLARGCVVIIRSIEVEMLVPVVVKYPCLMMAWDDGKKTAKIARKIVKADFSLPAPYIDDFNCAWQNAEPLTTDELEEIGLK